MRPLPVLSRLTQEDAPHLSTTPFQAVVESNDVTPEPPLLQTEQSQFPQLLLIRLVLQTTKQLCYPSLSVLQCLNVFFVVVVRGSKLSTVRGATSPEIP